MKLLQLLTNLESFKIFLELQVESNLPPAAWQHVQLEHSTMAKFDSDALGGGGKTLDWSTFLMAERC